MDSGRVDRGVLAVVDARRGGPDDDWLADSGFTGLLHRTVVVLNDSDGHADRKTRATLSEFFSRHGQT